MPILIEGVVRGGKIVLVDGPDLADGQRVQVVIDPQSVIAEPFAVGSVSEEGQVHTPLEDPDLIELLDRIRGERLPLSPSPSGPGRRSAAGRLAADPTWDEHLRDVLELRKGGTYREFSE